MAKLISSVFILKVCIVRIDDLHNNTYFQNNNNTLYNKDMATIPHDVIGLCPDLVLIEWGTHHFMMVLETFFVFDSEGWEPASEEYKRETQNTLNEVIV